MNTLTGTLTDAAFGPTPAHWPLPAAHRPEDRWLRAVAAGGQGRYAAALAELANVGRSGCEPSLRSLALSTTASFLRQLGRHTEARGWDGRALACAGTDPDARADAMLGLAADALGVGRFALSSRLLTLAQDAVADASPRLPVRLAWVTAELAMATGQGAAAVGHAERAVALVAPGTALASTRHAVKSDVVLAAALCCGGSIDESRRVADAALDTAREHGLVPLTWALACLLCDIGSATHDPGDVAALRADSAALVGHRGGAWA